MKNIFTILYAILAVAAVAMPVREYLSDGAVSTNCLVRSGAMLLVILLCILRSRRKAIRTREQNRVKYRESYAGYIGNVFPEDAAAQNMLFDAVDAYVGKRYASGWKRLQKLRPLCKTPEDTYAVAVFSGFCLHNLEKFEQALEQYREALALRQDSTIASNMGVCYEKLGLPDFAMRYYRIAIISDPDNPLPNNNLAQICVRNGDYAQAMVYASHALAVKEDMLPALIAMAVSSHMLGRKEDYELYRKKALENGADEAKFNAFLQTLE